MEGEEGEGSVFTGGVYCATQQELKWMFCHNLTKIRGFNSHQCVANECDFCSGAASNPLSVEMHPKFVFWMK